MKGEHLEPAQAQYFEAAISEAERIHGEVLEMMVADEEYIASLTTHEINKLNKELRDEGFEPIEPRSITDAKDEGPFEGDDSDGIESEVSTGFLSEGTRVRLSDKEQMIQELSSEIGSQNKPNETKKNRI